MIKQEVDGLCYLEFPHLRQYSFVAHGLFTRKGGISEKPFDSLDMGSAGSDIDDKVLGNRQAVLEIMGFEYTLSLKQVHGDKVLCWDSSNPAEIPPEADAVITDRPGVLLMIRTADCQPVLLLDPVKKVVANIHSGWRGSVANIAGKTVGVMVDSYGCNSEDIIAGIGPSLGPCCAEFVNYRTELPESFLPFKDDEHYFNFWEISRKQLESSGVLTKNIILSSYCTACNDNKDLFFSYRRDKLTGRLANVIGLRKTG